MNPRVERIFLQIGFIDVFNKLFDLKNGTDIGWRCEEINIFNSFLNLYFSLVSIYNFKLHWVVYNSAVHQVPQILKFILIGALAEYEYFAESPILDMK